MVYASNVKLFGLHSGHLNEEASGIAKKHGAVHYNYHDESGKPRGWFAADGPQARAVAGAVMDEINTSGGIERFILQCGGCGKYCEDGELIECVEIDDKEFQTEQGCFTLLCSWCENELKNHYVAKEVVV